MDGYARLYLKWITNNDLHSTGAPLNVTWQAGWEGSSGENGYMCRSGRVPLRSTSNYHSHR